MKGCDPNACDPVVQAQATIASLQALLDHRTDERNQALVALEHLVRAALANPVAGPGENQLLTYDTWSICKSQPATEAMRRALVVLARARGLSTFGNDWQEAMS